MFKLIIVDDEEHIRKGLATLNWQELDIKVCGEFKHGLEAFKYIKEHAVDIVLLDIKMPIMDGLELAKKINQYTKRTKIIMLTGYDDFNYVQKCLRYNVYDYLLKPINFDGLMLTIEKVLQVIKKERKQTKIQHEVKNKNHSLVSFFRANFLSRFLYEKMAEDEIEEGIILGELFCENHTQGTVAVFYLNAIKDNFKVYSNEDLALIDFALCNILDEFLVLENKGYYLLNLKQGKIVLLIWAECQNMVEDILSKIIRLRGLIKSTVLVGVGREKPFPNLYQSTIEAEKILDLKINVEEEGIFYYIDFKHIVAKNNEADQGTNICKSTNHIITQAMTYIEANYTNVITLEMVATNVFVNKSYLSYLFKQETGMNFVDFLSHTRMNEAKKLLKCSNLKVYEIGEKVGYDNPRYFSYLFKQKIGKTPKQFRDT